MNANLVNGENILRRLRSTIMSLTPAERRVANLCLLDCSAFIKMPVGDIAEYAHVSKPTVVRFCRSAGFDGLTDFKRKLKFASEESIPYIHQSVGKSDDSSRVSYKIVDNLVSSAISFRKSIRTSSIDNVVQLIAHAHLNGGRIVFMGIGASALAALDAKSKFYRLGVNVQSFTERHEQILAGSLAKQDDVFIFFSSSGKTTDLIETCHIVNSTGASTVAIAPINSALYVLSRFGLSLENWELFETCSPMLSRILQLVVLDILATCFAIKVGVDGMIDDLLRYSKNISKTRA